MKITQATRIALNIPFYADRVRAAMHRAQSASERVYVYRVESDNGLVGWGDAEASVPVEGLIGKNPYAIMHDDRIGHGPQVAVLDLAGKDAGVPVHALIGTKLRDRCPLSWWAIDMPPADWAVEARESIKHGYTCFKGKARPWWDLVEQVEAVAKVVPTDFKLDLDFNGFLLTPANAEILLHELDGHANVGVYESPFYLQNDLDGAKLLCSRMRKPIVEHFHEAVLHARASDGLIIDQGLTLSMAQASLAASFHKPFWLQLPGSGLTTTFAAHLGSVLSHATLPYITGFQMWESDLLSERIPVTDGYMPVPDRPGLGVEVDEKAIEKYTVDERELTPRLRYRLEKRIWRVVRPGAGNRQRVWEFTDGTVCQNLLSTGSIPGFERGVRLEVIEDDHSAAFTKHHQKTLQQERLT
jgi:L-alanine-DL-glutamate epimerase-like enolase superfamily enzyme